MRDAIDLNLEAIRSIRTEVDSRPFGKKNGKKKGYIYIRKYDITYIPFLR